MKHQKREIAGGLAKEGLQRGVQRSLIPERRALSRPQPLGTHGPVSPAPPGRAGPPGGDSPRGGTRAPPQPGTATGTGRTPRDPASTYIAVPLGTWHPPAIPGGHPGIQRSFQSLWTSQSLADIPYTRQTSWYPAGILGTCCASLHPVGILSAWQPPSSLWAPCGHPLPLNPVQRFPVRELWRKDRACFSPVSLQGDKGYPGHPSTCWASWHPLGILAPSGRSDTPSGQQCLSREMLVI